MNLVLVQRILWIAATLLLAAGCASSTQVPAVTKDADAIAAPKTKTPVEIASQVESAVVTIHAYADNQVVSTGTGFFIRGDGTLVTSLHVVINADSLRVELADGEIFDDVYVLAADDERDLIVLQVPTSGTPSITIADDRDLRIGDTVYVVGNPLGLRSTFSDGIVSAKRTRDGVNYLQITAPISQGSSGGPVLNSLGGVVGVATSYLGGGQNLNMAVPARHADGLLAMAGTPELFDVLVASVVDEEESYVAPATTRAAETSELAASLSPD
jgi:S1-C subfamily serine protease